MPNIEYNVTELPRRSQRPVPSGARPYMYSTPRANNFFYRYGCPVTMFLIAINVVSFFTINTLQTNDPFLRWAIFRTALWPEQFWTAVTWPLVGATSPLCLLFACLWTFWICGSLERSWGLRTFTAFFFAMAAITALMTWIGASLLRETTELAGLYIAIGAPTVAWCAINPRESVNFWGFITIPAPWLAWLTIVLVWYYVGPPIIGLFALSGCAAAFWYARYGRYAYRGYASSSNPLRRSRSGKAPVLRLETVDEERGRRVRRSVSPLGWWRARQERQKLEKLWNRSISQEPPDEKRRP